MIWTTHGGVIAGLIIGIMIIIAGISWLTGINLERHFWPFIVIIFGILIVAGALYGYSRKSKRTLSFYGR